PQDLDLFRYVETAENALHLIQNWEPGPPRDQIPGR
ncbi:MAG: lysine decarboxylase, partial [Pseudomonadota bacterium]